MHAVYHVVYDGPDPGDPPSQDKLDDWITTYELVNNVLVPDEPDHAEEAFDRRECTYLVQTADMTVTWKLCTCTGGNCTTSAEVGLAELAAALR
ncbi:MAG: hypothetical protein RIF41_19770 [Polyangiaceae bacterium]